MLTEKQRLAFNYNGFLVIKNVANTEWLEKFHQVTEKLLSEALPPIEYEADLQYPGAPNSKGGIGGRTIRRIRQAFGRDPLFNQWINHPTLKSVVQSIVGSPSWLVKAHHNCVMTKFPEHSSDSLWHQDLRYWSYSKGELVTSWLALCHEHAENGCLQVIPGSHKLNFDASRFDEKAFFKAKHSENMAMFRQAKVVELDPGDLLIFHCRLIHAAMRNFTTQPKFAVVMTFRGEQDQPIEGSRSDLGGEVEMV
ncbi:MAG: phytanoyl-CoA dioxygenase family protein [Pseudomonadota bacterium]